MYFRKLPSVEKVRSVLDYNPLTGIFIWKYNPDYPQKWNTRYAGTRAGRLSPNGHRAISIEKVRYQAHRLAWIYMTGKKPGEEIDHKNTLRDDNRWSNLREATSLQNKANSNLRSDNTSGSKGVHWDKSRGKWVVIVSIDRSSKNLGRFDSKEKALNVYKKYMDERFGEFSRVA